MAYQTVNMKNLLLSLLAVALLTGCMHNYDFTLKNGMKITRVSKPKLDKDAGIYNYTDIRGEKKSISASRVVEIAPHSEDKTKPKQRPPQSP
jgi:hypothetical protein